MIFIRKKNEKNNSYFNVDFNIWNFGIWISMGNVLSMPYHRNVIGKEIEK